MIFILILMLCSSICLKWWFFPQTGLPVGFYLRKKETGHAGGRAVLCWARIWLCWARWARLGTDLALLGALGWVGRGVWLWWARWAGLGADLAFCAWSTLYMSSSCLHDVFVFNFMCISYVYHGACAKQGLALVNETWFWASPCSKSVMWSERNGSKRRETAVAANQHSLKRTA